MTLSVVVSVGSDSHPFHRLVEALDDWLQQTPHEVSATLQFGTSHPPRHPERWEIATAFLPFEDLQALMSTADIIITQGGPTGIAEARRYGVRPVVMPRRSDLGEHVDDHQVAFCRQLARVGHIVLAETTAQLYEELKRTSNDPGSLRTSLGEDPAIRVSVERFSGLVAELKPRSGLFGIGSRLTGPR